LFKGNSLQDMISIRWLLSYIHAHNNDYVNTEVLEIDYSYLTTI